MSENFDTPQKYFDYVKDKKKYIDNKFLDNCYSNAMELMKKYIATGQIQPAKRLLYYLENVIAKEYEIYQKGINCFVYKADVEEYIEEVAEKTVKIIEMERYEREIPDDVVSKIALVRPYFDQLYILFTDYTGKVEKKVAKERRDKDPIVFGVFMHEQSEYMCERFYYIADWIDEYCDLTLDKLIEQMRESKNKEVVYDINMPNSLDEFRNYLNNFDKKHKDIIAEKNIIEKNKPIEKGFFKRIFNKFFNK